MRTTRHRALTTSSRGSSRRYHDRREAHYREHRRRRLGVAARVDVLLPDGSPWDSGLGEVTDVSASGALITGLHLEGGRYPVGEFRVEAALRGGGYEGIRLRGRPVRLTDEGYGLGLRLDGVDCRV
jgi:hypothetical protein